MSLPKTPEFILHRDSRDASDSATYSDIDEKYGVESNDFTTVCMNIKLEGASPDISFKILVWDDDLGWLDSGIAFNNVAANAAKTFDIHGRKFFVHITINDVDGDEVIHVKVGGHYRILQSA